MLIKTDNRLDLVEALLNECCKDKTKYCNNCEANFVRENMPCCDDPQIGTMRDHLRAVVLENEIIRKNLHKDTGISHGGNMRIAFRLPFRPYKIIKDYIVRYLTQLKLKGADIPDNEMNFPRDQKESRAIMKRFKKFCIPDRI